MNELGVSFHEIEKFIKRPLSAAEVAAIES
jgi:hypothetical protein